MLNHGLNYRTQAEAEKDGWIRTNYEFGLAPVFVRGEEGLLFRDVEDDLSPKYLFRFSLKSARSRDRMS